MSSPLPPLLLLAEWGVVVGLTAAATGTGSLDFTAAAVGILCVILGALLLLLLLVNGDARSQPTSTESFIENTRWDLLLLLLLLLLPVLESAAYSFPLPSTISPSARH
jgi:hypothetical protein